MPGEWKRPESVPFPQIWSRFDGKREINGKIPKFWIQDIPEDMFGTAGDFMCSNYLYEEPLCKYSNLCDDILSVEESREIWKIVASEKLGLMCFMENPDPNNDQPIIAGVNITCIKTRDELFPQIAGEKLQLMVNTIIILYEKKNTFDMIGEDQYLNAIGMSVLPEFRGQGIGEQLLLARAPLCRAVGLKATFSVFTSAVSQKLAERVGFQDIVSMPYEDLEKLDPRLKYPGITEHEKNIRLADPIEISIKTVCPAKLKWMDFNGWSFDWMQATKRSQYYFS